MNHESPSTVRFPLNAATEVSNKFIYWRREPGSSFSSEVLYLSLIYRLSGNPNIPRCIANDSPNLWGFDAKEVPVWSAFLPLAIPELLLHRRFKFFWCLLFEILT
jgi:hypothetical protein